MRVLPPIVHKDAYSRRVDVEIRRYFDETIFAPLFGILRTARVPDNIENAIDEWRPFPTELRSLGIMRAAMPQVRTSDHAALFAHLESLGIACETLTVPASWLCPSQRDFSPEKVEAVQGFDEFAPVLTSADGYVVDGHHRWFARYLADPEAMIPIIRFAERARPLISHVRTFRNAYRENAAGDTPLVQALKTARVWYADGTFYGQFSAAVAGELRGYGATFDARTNAFLLPSSQVPMNIRGVLVASVDRAQDVHRKVIDFLAQAETNVQIAVTGIEVDQALSFIRGDLWRQLEHTVKGIDFIEVPAQLTQESVEALAKDFTTSLDLPIRNFLDTELPELRRQVEANAFAGYRADRLAQIIEARYGVTKRKAAFLAEQETSLLVSKFREQRYKAIGSERYKWSTSHDEKVRHDHKLLNGTVQLWASKPVTNRKTGARNHPGEDFRCRCVAMPIIEALGDTGTRVNAREFHCARSSSTVRKTPR